jgi:hypothetical protein
MDRQEQTVLVFQILSKHHSQILINSVILQGGNTLIMLVCCTLRMDGKNGGVKPQDVRYVLQ